MFTYGEGRASLVASTSVDGVNESDMSRCPVCDQRPRSETPHLTSVILGLMMSVVLAGLLFAILVTPLLWVLHRAWGWAFA